MAGDWIKMRADLPNDPAVYKIAGLTASDRFTVVGRLYAFWSWADRHAVDGRVDGASSMVVDDITSCPGFAAALVSVKWLVTGEDFVLIPNHERHNGESAKERGLKNARQARWREGKAKDASTDVVDKPSTSASTREEKRREDNSVPNGTDGAAVIDDKTKAELWKTGKSLLAEQGMPTAQCGSFVGKLCKDHGDEIVIEAVRATVVKRPADAAEFLVATCRTLAGLRKQPEPEWRSEQRQRTQQAAPGVASNAAPADQFFIEVEARRVTANAVG